MPFGRTGGDAGRPAGAGGRSQVKSQWEQEKEVMAWNERYPPGTPVRVRLDSGEVLETKTRSDAQMLGGHTAVVWLDGIAGAYLLERVTAE